ncbi:SHOCT domain-containing protein [Phycicoccus sp. SLBN-51]|uniref:SHOCT domain-containing protein n=1 Tax=Phycicoccus sp. SLBN-51 TaxID=2768447 RepID=UPI00114EE31A|nr:SHOCT domain-containing protein [Phycicoccus sp. SLBN-51]TQJ49290.1 putative membrane protein [Phycicoccus sp. SLBN-51]
MMWNYGMGWGGWLLMTLTTVGFWALVVFGIVALFRGGRGTNPGTGQGAGQGWNRGAQEDEAQHILDERFARGDIDAEEYRRRRQVLHTP